MTNKTMVNDILDELEELKTDNTVPKNIKSKIEIIIPMLKEEKEFSMNISKAQAIIEEISEDNNIQTYTRTQIYNIASTLETIQINN